MTRSLCSVMLIAAVACFATPALAYKQPTHMEMSTAAVNQSVLTTDPDVLMRMGLSVSRRFPDGVGTQRNIPDLIRQGASLEDELPWSANHFFNPITGAGLGGHPSPDWALEDKGEVTFLLLSQDYSYREARRYMYLALTENNVSERERNWGLAFRTLGHVIHHLQDMAQPQHARVDSHCDLLICPPQPFPNPTLYEEYTDERRKLGRLRYTGYDPVYSAGDTITFNSARRFWQTQDGKGIAEYTNRNFVSAGTNFNAGQLRTSPIPPFIFPQPDFPRPNTAGMNPEFVVMDITDPSLLGRDQPLRGKITFIRTAVDDALRPDPANAINERASSYTVFNPDLRAKSILPKFTLNKFNFDEAHKFLIQRAVGYSSGFINYFLRGKIDCRKDQNIPSGCRIRNLSPDPMTGTFELYYDTVDGIRLPVPNARWTAVNILPSNPSDPNDGFAANFTPPSEPRPRHRGDYVLVFNGDLGAEKETNSWVGAVVGLVIESYPILAPGHSDHGLATSRGLAYGWGRNQHAQIGSGQTNFVPPYGTAGPISVRSQTSLFGPLFNVATVARGAEHSLALLRDGTVVGWGDNQMAETGSGRTSFIEPLPFPVAGLTDVVAIAAGGFYLWGGSSQSMALKRDGTVWAWGGNAYGQVGNGTASTFVGVAAPVRVSGLTSVLEVSAGGFHSLALRSDGTVWSWGQNWYGQLGNGGFQQFGAVGGTLSPIAVPGLSEVIAIAAGGLHSLALKADGTVWSWGSNDSGQIGNGSFQTVRPFGEPLPVKVVGLSDVIGVAAGGTHSLALKRDGTVWAWGANGRGQIGLGSFTTRQTLPVQVSGVSDIVEIAGGNTFSLALKRDGNVWSWGGNEFGELAQGDFTYSPPYGRAVAARSYVFINFQ